MWQVELKSKAIYKAVSSSKRWADIVAPASDFASESLWEHLSKSSGHVEVVFNGVIYNSFNLTGGSRSHQTISTPYFRYRRTVGYDKNKGIWYFHIIDREAFFEYYISLQNEEIQNFYQENSLSETLNLISPPPPYLTILRRIENVTANLFEQMFGRGYVMKATYDQETPEIL